MFLNLKNVFPPIVADSTANAEPEDASVLSPQQSTDDGPEKSRTRSRLGPAPNTSTARSWPRRRAAEKTMRTSLDDMALNPSTKSPLLYAVRGTATRFVSPKLRDQQLEAAPNGVPSDRWCV